MQFIFNDRTIYSIATLVTSMLTIMLKYKKKYCIQKNKKN
jgi:hypothetical protein